MKEGTDRRVTGLGAGNDSAATQPPHFCEWVKRRMSMHHVMCVLERRMALARKASNEAWEAWKVDRDDAKKLRSYVAKLRRCYRLRESMAAVMDGVVSW